MKPGLILLEMTHPGLDLQRIAKARLDSIAVGFMRRDVELVERLIHLKIQKISVGRKVRWEIMSFGPGRIPIREIL